MEKEIIENNLLIDNLNEVGKENTMIGDYDDSRIEKLLLNYEDKTIDFITKVVNLNSNCILWLTNKNGRVVEYITTTITSRFRLKNVLINLLDYDDISKLIEDITSKNTQMVIVIKNSKHLEHLLSLDVRNKEISRTKIREFFKVIKHKIESTKIKLIFTCVDTLDLFDKDIFDYTENLQQFTNGSLELYYDEYLYKHHLDKSAILSIKYVFVKNDIVLVHSTIMKMIDMAIKNSSLDTEKFIKDLKNKFIGNDTLMDTKIPKVRWEDIGGLDNIKDELIKSFSILKSKDVIVAKSSYLEQKKGVLFFGPPGTGKTLLAKCIATECQASFLTVKGPELLNKYIGESEKNMRDVFEKARTIAPCIIFFDELDSLLPRKGISGDSAQVTDRMVSQFLTELESSPRDVLIIAATNRPDLLDSSILLSGKFDKKIYIGIMNGKEQRINILKSILKEYKLSKDLNYEILEDIFPQKITGADFYGIVSKALKIAVNKLKVKVNLYLKENGVDLKEFKSLMEKDPIKFKDFIDLRLDIDDFQESCKHFTPSVNSVDQHNYEQLAKQYADLVIS